MHSAKYHEESNHIRSLVSSVAGLPRACLVYEQCADFLPAVFSVF